MICEVVETLDPEFSRINHAPSIYSINETLLTRRGNKLKNVEIITPNDNRNNPSILSLLVKLAAPYTIKKMNKAIVVVKLICLNATASPSACKYASS